jgi:hypothetical protein
MSGYSRSSFASFGKRIASAAYSVAVMRMVPAGLLAQFAHRRELMLDLVEARADVAQQTFPRFGRSDAARGAGEQANFQPRFEFTNGVAERRLRNAELRRGLGETAFARHRDKGEKVVEIGALHLSRPLISPCGL